MKFYIYTLGCKVNTYESSVMRDNLLEAGYEESSNKEEADIYIINTCTVTNTSDNKSLKMIRQAIRENKDAIVVVTGCMSQIRYKELSKIEGIDIIIGSYGKNNIVNYIKEYQKNKKQIIDIKDLNLVEFESMNLNEFKHIRAFVKIQDGCEYF